jgi:uncharacterized delta-60 repeat protein
MSRSSNVLSRTLRPTAVRFHGRPLWRICAMLCLLSAVGLFAGPLGVSSAAYARGGDLDPTFGLSGKVTQPGDPYHQAKALVVQGSKLVAAGHALSDTVGDFALARYNADGSLDTSFGVDGMVTTDFAGSLDDAAALASQGDKLVASGLTFTETDIDVALARYNPDGSLDTSFGAGGKVITDFVGADRATAVVALSNGKVVIAGFTITVAGRPNVILARYNADGSLDSTFGVNGKVITDVPGIAEAFALAVQADGKLVVAGIAGPLGSGDLNQNFALARYNPDGSLDTSFGADGTVDTDIGGRTNDQANALAVLANGKLVAAGSAADPLTGRSDTALARYNPDGSLDRSFGARGTARIDLAPGDFDQANALAVQVNGQLVTAGFAVTAQGGYDFALARYQPHGVLDASFGIGGVVLTDFGGTDEASALGVQADGKLVAAGFTAVSGNLDFALARFLAS